MKNRKSDGVNRKLGPDREEAQSIAIAALSHIASEPSLFERFSGLTGLAPADMRNAARSPGFLPAVLDFLAGHEPDLLAFAAASGLDPARIMAARDLLAGRDL